MLRNIRLPIRGIIPVLAQDYEIGGGFPTIKAYGLDKLVDVMSDVLPEAVRDTFVAIQIVNLDAKHASAKRPSPQQPLRPQQRERRPFRSRMRHFWFLRRWRC